MRVVVTGAGGLLAAAVIREFLGQEPAGELLNLADPAAGAGQGRARSGGPARRADVVALDRAALDVTDPSAVQRTLEHAAPDVIVNCVAHNGVDRAETEAESALRVNAFAVRTLAACARALRATLVHYSTDFVFDGVATRPYAEEDAPNPRSVYGASKLLGEWFALDYPAAYVLRVESLFGEPGPTGSRRGSVDTIVARIRAGEPVPVFVDRTVSPSYTPDVAKATRALLERGAPPGLYHCVNTGASTWAEVAGEAARLLERPIEIRPITLESAALTAPRPRYCALSNVKLAAAGIVMPAWQDALRRYLVRP